MYKVLIVEDEKLIRQRLVYGIDFADLDCMVIGEARDGKEGREMIDTFNPDIVLTDINMPVMDAFGMLEQTMQTSYCTIILSGYNEFSNAQKAIKYGVTEFVVKPFKEEEIIEAINRAKRQVDEQRHLEQWQQTRRLKDNKLFHLEKLTFEDPVVGDMLDYVHEHFSTKFVFSDVAKEIGYSPALLHDKFKKETGTTFNDYLNRYRINQSIQMMRNGEMKLYDIAPACGFSEYKYYNKVFKKYIGISTKEFLEKL